MRRVVLAGEHPGQVGIALPVGVDVSVGEAAVASGIGSIIASRAPVGQRVAVGVADDLRGLTTAGEITLAAGIAPGAFRIPMPGLDVQLGILTIAHGLPARAENFLESLFGEELVDGWGRHAINARAQGLIGDELVGNVIGRDIDMNRLRARHQGSEG